MYVYIILIHTYMYIYIHVDMEIHSRATFTTLLLLGSPGITISGDLGIAEQERLNQRAIEETKATTI